MDRFSQFANVAADQAVADSKLDLEKIDKKRVGHALIEQDCVNGIPTDLIEGSRTDCHCKVKVLRPVTLQWLDARHGRSSEKRSSPLISAGVQSSEGLCYSHRLLCILMASALYRPTRMRLCTNLPQRFAVSANDSCRIAFGQRTQRPSHVTFLRNVPLLSH